jgi:hypothetical protein
MCFAENSYTQFLFKKLGKELNPNNGEPNPTAI